MSLKKNNNQSSSLFSGIGLNDSEVETVTNIDPNLGGNQKILVVDDDQDILPLISELLAALNYEAITAPGPKEALTLLDNGINPELLLTDIDMPDINGFELAEKIKEVKPDIGVVYMSGFAASVSHLSTVKVQAKLLQKPFQLSSLSHALFDALH